MKKLFAVMMACMLMVALAACGSAGSNIEKPAVSELSVTETPVAEVESEQETEERTSWADTSEATTEPETESEDTAATELVVYFSWSGNTETVAMEIQNQTGADSFRLVPVEPYTDDYDALLNIAQEEQRNGARPAISGSIENFDSYEVVYLGFPIWWGDMPMILYSFLDDYDLSGKTIVPFVTSGGSGFSNTISTIESMEPNAEVLDGLSLGSSQTDNPGDAVVSWLSGLGLAE